jgi:hypothetical protein
VETFEVWGARNRMSFREKDGETGERCKRICIGSWKPPFNNRQINVTTPYAVVGGFLVQDRDSHADRTPSTAQSITPKAYIDSNSDIGMFEATKDVSRLGHKRDIWARVDGSMGTTFLGVADTIVGEQTHGKDVGERGILPAVLGLPPGIATAPVAAKQGLAADTEALELGERGECLNWVVRGGY